VALLSAKRTFILLSLLFHSCGCAEGGLSSGGYVLDPGCDDFQMGRQHSCSQMSCVGLLDASMAKMSLLLSAGTCVSSTLGSEVFGIVKDTVDWVISSARAGVTRVFLPNAVKMATEVAVPG
jgi:hypothetical protein